MKILVISNVSTVDRNYGSGVILSDFLEWFSKAGAEVHFISVAKFSNRMAARRFVAAKLPGRARELLPGFFRIGKSWISISLISWAKWLLRKLNIPQSNGTFTHCKYDQILNESDAKAISCLAEAGSYDAVIADYVWCAPVFIPMNSQSIRKGIIAHDIVQNRIASFRKSGSASDISEEVGASEIYLLGAADFVCVETNEDQIFLKERNPNLEVFLMPRALHVQADRSHSIEKSILFIGGRAPHNLQGISWFLSNVWPRVISEFNEAKLWVIGEVAKLIENDQPNVELIGPVEDLSPFYRKSALCIIPLQSGSGFKTKLIEALAFGKACVSTPIGAAGVTHLKEPPVVITESINEFADATITFLKDSSVRLQYEQRAIDYIEQFHSPDSVYTPILESLKQSCTK